MSSKAVLASLNSVQSLEVCFEMQLVLDVRRASSNIIDTESRRCWNKSQDAQNLINERLRMVTIAVHFYGVVRRADSVMQALGIEFC